MDLKDWKRLSDYEIDQMEMDPIEAEVDAIRKQIWEETKHMTPEERTADLIRRTDPIEKQFHIRTSKLKPAEMRDPAEVMAEIAAERAKLYEDYNSL